MNAPQSSVAHARRKDQILQSASACIARLGLRVRVEDIVQDARISRATFYRHFENMDAVLVQLAAGAAREMLTTAVAASRQAEMCTVRRIAYAVAIMVDRSLDPPIIALLGESDALTRLSNLIMLDEEAMAVLSAPLVPLLQEAIEAGALRSDMSMTKMIEWLTRNQTSIRYRRPPWAGTVSQLQDYALEFVIPPLLSRRAEPGTQLVLDRLDALQAQIRNMANREALDR